MEALLPDQAEASVAQLVKDLEKVLQGGATDLCNWVQFSVMAKEVEKKHEVNPGVNIRFGK